METSVYTYCWTPFDGRIFTKIVTRAEIASATVTLFKNDLPAGKKDATRKLVMFKDQDVGTYKSVAEISFSDATVLTVESTAINITSQPAVAAKRYAPAVNVKGHQQCYDNVKRYDLELMLQPGTLKKLMQESVRSIPKSHGLIHHASFDKVSLKAFWEDDEPEGEGERYFIACHIDNGEIIALAQELECLDYVIYCALVPDLKNLPPPALPLTTQREAGLPSPGGPRTTSEFTSTPDLTGYQSYLRAGAGMNVEAVWEMGVKANFATVHILDFGLYQNHEDIKDNVSVVTNRPETEPLDVGTASTGCIAAMRNSFGMTGVAHDCHCYFYDTGDLARAYARAGTGDIVCLSFGLSINGRSVPLTHDLWFWQRIRDFSNYGIIVLVAAGHSGTDLSPEAGNINEYGDNGSILVGACDAVSGRRLDFSNHSHPTSLLNSWGHYVATTGFGDLSGNSNETNYTALFAGTAAPTALCAGALALVQSDTFEVHGRFHTPDSIRELVRKSPNSQGVEDNIGYRPDVSAFIWGAAHEEVFRINTADQFAAMDDSNYLYQQFSNSNAIAIDASNSAWRLEIYFPSPNILPQGKIISFVSHADRTLTLIVNGQRILMAIGSVRRFIVQNDVWTTLNSYLINTPDQFISLGSRNYLTEQVQGSQEVAIAAREGVWRPWILFPEVSEVPHGRIISITTQALLDITLTVNRRSIVVKQGDAIVFFAGTTRWEKMH